MYKGVKIWNNISLAQQFPNWATRDFARGAAKVVVFVVGLRTLGVWCQVCSVSQNCIMEKYCLED